MGITRPSGASSIGTTQDDGRYEYVMIEDMPIEAEGIMSLGTLQLQPAPLKEIMQLLETDR